MTATTIGTSTTTSSIVYPAQKSIGWASDGTLWRMIPDGTTVEFWYSTDDGASWTQNTSMNFTISTAGSDESASFAIGDDDRAVVVYAEDDGSGDTEIMARWMSAITTTASWSAEVTVYAGEPDTEIGWPDVTVHSASTGTTWAHVVWFNENKTTEIRNKSYVINAAGTTFITFTSGEIAVCDASSLLGHPTVWYRHSGDGKTPTSNTPDLYCSCQSGTGELRVVRATYSGGSYSWDFAGGMSVSDTISNEMITSCFDGDRVVVAWADSSTTVDIVERNAADTTTTHRVPPALGDGTITGIAVTFEQVTKDILLFAVGTTSDDVSYTVYDRSANSWSSWAVLEADTARQRTLNCISSIHDYAAEVTWQDQTSPDNVKFERLTIDVAPNQPVFSTQSGVAYDVDEILALAWSYDDPNTGDTQSAWDIERTIGAGSAEYWRDSDSSWQATAQSNSGAVTSLNLAASWGADGDGNHVYRARVEDTASNQSPWSDPLTVIPSAQDNPSLTAPADSSTQTTATITVTWTVSTQTAYRVRIYDTAGTTTLHDTGFVVSTDTSISPSYVHADGTDFKVGIVTKNDEGLESDEDIHDYTVDFVDPPTPTLVITGQDAAGHIDVAITNPAPGGGEPDLDFNDVFVRVAAGGTADGDRPVVGDGVRIATNVAEDATYNDHAVKSGVDYEYLVRAWGDNGAFADSAWT